MNNSEMTKGRILKLQTGKRLYNAIIEHLETDHNVLILTYTRGIKLAQKHISMIKMDKRGSVYVQSGKHWNCIDFNAVKFI